jgi:hypothetical protein
MPVLVGGVRDAKLDDALMKQLAEHIERRPASAHRDQRLEISLLALFSYDKLSTVE